MPRNSKSSCKIEVRHCIALLSVLAVGSCFAEREPVALRRGPPAGVGLTPSGGGEGGGGDVPGAGGEPTPVQVVRCAKVDSMEPLPARGAVMSSDVVATSRRVYVTTIFDLFSNQCKACHIDSALGDPPFQIRSASEFPEKMSERFDDVIARIESEDPDEYMPPPPAGRPWTKRQEGDPVLTLSTLLHQWKEAGEPRDLFEVQTGDAGQSPYLLTPEVGGRLTNIGNCVPDKILYAAPRSDELDEMFAGLERLPPGEGSPRERIGLPLRLEETDLFTLDSKALAEHGVVAFAPEYPLWSDGSGKLRHVRVPRGESIHYDPETREFQIPENTRFYKTFLKKVVDSEGQESYRKIETRLIVSRQDRQREDGTWESRALFGSYAWSEDETEAVLVTDTLRNGEPFADRVFFYELDEQEALAKREEVRAREATLGIDLDENYEVESAGLIRHYAIPGSERCIQCHMGSPSKSFVLGMTPLQIRRVPTGESGAYEPTGPDEQSQLRRLIDYGVITGIDDPDDLDRLEDSEGARKPRNDYELAAQAYMLGNCAHCHNPRGFPTSRAPELEHLLNFFPSEEGGIFQFPLEAVSPRIRRGIDRDVPIPYITPSLRDYIPRQGGGDRWTPKYSETVVGQNSIFEHLDAPWRSLIYRNTSTPFTYADDFAFFPHMPMNTAGHDCRTAQILGDWMVSIPGKRKHPELFEDFAVDPGQVGRQDEVDREPQPYLEVKEGEPGYAQALADAERRLTEWHDGEMYAICPSDDETQYDGRADILDKAVMRGEVVVPADGERHDIPFKDGVPDRPHFVQTDLTEVPGDWTPRRSDWEDVIVDQHFPALDMTSSHYAAEKAEQDAEKNVVSLLQGMTLTPAFRAFGLRELPFGLWKKKPECDFSGISKVSDFTGPARPLWMDRAPAKDQPESPVYSILPGGAVYRMICINCHGPQADSHGVLAENLQVMTGGRARVANFRTGLFGTLDAPGSNRPRVFGDTADATGLSADDWGARYMGWMALGGTEVDIPASILDNVAATNVLDQARRGFAVTASANMLTVAEELCRFTLPVNRNIDVKFDVLSGRATIGLPLILNNGDSELWESLCSFDNPIPVRALQFSSGSGSPVLRVAAERSFFDRSTYPSTAYVGNHRGDIVQGLDATNLAPWCVVKPTDPAELAAADQFVTENARGGQPLPYCPPAVTADERPHSEEGHRWTIDELHDWATRGALNAGFAVFLYLDQVSKGFVPKSYQECELLQ